MLLLMTPLEYDRFTRLFNPILLQTPEIYEHRKKKMVCQGSAQVPWVVLKDWTDHGPGKIISKQPEQSK